MNRAQFNQHIKSADFRILFNELGWDNVRNAQYDTTIAIDDTDFELKAVAHKSGFIVYQCLVDEIPQNAMCRKIDMRLRKYSNDYILIFIKHNVEHHLWITPVKTIEKRDLVTVEYGTVLQAEFLFSKLDSISFDIDEVVTIVDVTARIHKAFEVNSGKITKDFYAGFKKQHNSFVAFIKGIEVEGDKQWYASVMLNRLMFCYFIQKKGFLNFDPDYLRNKLEWTKQQRGDNQFFNSFYKGFLCVLFHGGLNNPTHNREFETIYGRIPYLNGGMFDEHQLEKQYEGIDIADEAFEELFGFFDKWRWHLDTRITATGKDINPDVLGYIFEQYINDRAQMGAYYTKEDITEYIGKNCIIPFLVDEVAKSTSSKNFKSNGFVWQMLKSSGDKYIYDAVKKGVNQPLPDYIEQGVDTALPELLERRARWNEKTHEELALPTEIWRETLERRNRYFDVRGKIERGEVTEINDFITYNLDIRSFVYDLIAKTEDHLFIKHFYGALQRVTILDPTCGSGAFLFAAMNILEPLYEVCIDRMIEFNGKNDKLFADELREIQNKYRSNIQHFVYKSIILRNLYGVDIMVEATEIAKLRLFLKMVAVVDVDRRADNLGLDPLPDIDFNIRCGNTLVGYATKDELMKDVTFGDIFARSEFEEKIELEMQKVAKAYERFKEIQINQHDNIEEFKQAKGLLQSRLKELNELLNRKMYASVDKYTYEEWLSSHQPFHWLAEFYQIIQGNGGFDVIIGNPPYVVYTERNFAYIISNSYRTLPCANLYAYCIERSNYILNNNGRFGMIVPNSSISADKLKPLQRIITENKKCWISNYSWRPSKLFEGADMLLAIIINCRTNLKEVHSSKYYKWYNEYRQSLFENVTYANTTNLLIEGSIPKIPANIFNVILSKMQTQASDKLLRYEMLLSMSEHKYYYFRAVQYWFKILDKEPVYLDNGVQCVTGEMKPIYVTSEYDKYIQIAILSSSLFFTHYITWSSCQVVNSRDFNMQMCISNLDKYKKDSLFELGKLLQTDFEINSHTIERNYSKKGRDFTMKKQHFFIKKSKPIIDEIDKVLAQHYGFTDEELDFIINYDIKYRMGSELDTDNE